eukprot:CAMPEP_0194073680 /NCGR_PEP_ID=MMETSP0149-20130528/1004_1 /TAXON_ID=122233 /ORGANISM="Chaetoceros debilis, Strain MM31A-1" /LENGTH=270 /DNA_ID=CAMNT_0038753719 /DNA_START=156 /DNA_END=968 /DNA_ORIENTATION=+
MEELEGSLLDPRATAALSQNQNQNISIAVPVSVANSGDSDVTTASASFIRATPVEPVGTAAAVPSNFFEYTEELVQQDEILHQAQITQATTVPVLESELKRLGIDDDNYNNSYNNNNIPMAPVLGRYEDNSPNAIEYETAAKVRVGSDIGRVHALRECERIVAVNREAQAKVYHEKARNDVGRAVAKQRVKEGFDARWREDKNIAKGREKEQMKQDSAFVKKGGKEKGGDYEVAEYQTGGGGSGNGGYEVDEYQTADYNNSDYEYKSVYD